MTQWNGATAQQLGLDAPHLDTIIRASADSKAQMNTLNVQVADLAPVIYSHMLSDPGRRTHSHLDTWVLDFQRIIRSMDALNERVTAMRNALVAANSNAGSQIPG